MEKLKGIMKSSLAQTHVQKIYWGQPTNMDYNAVILQYKSLNHENKLSFQQRLIKKINKGHNSKIDIATLHLMSLLINQGYRYSCLYDQTPKINVQDIRNVRDKKNAMKAHQIYYKFIQRQNRKPVFKNNKISSLTTDQQTMYCDIAIQQLKQIIHQSQHLLYYVEHSNNKIIGLIIVDFIMRVVSQDLKILNELLGYFINNIRSQNSNILLSNYIYEGLINICKDNMFNCLIRLNTKIDRKYTLQRYHLDPQINTNIQKIMKKYQEDYQQFLVQKIYTKQVSMKLINPQEKDNGTQIIDERDILLKCDQFDI